MKPIVFSAIMFFLFSISSTKKITPEIKLKRTPEYPQAAVENIVEGTVIFKILINKEGDTEDVSLIKGIYPDSIGLNRAALEAVSDYKWKPVVSENDTIEIWHNVPIGFFWKNRNLYKMNREFENFVLNNNKEIDTLYYAINEEVLDSKADYKGIANSLEENELIKVIFDLEGNPIYFHFTPVEKQNSFDENKISKLKKLKLNFISNYKYSIFIIQMD